MGKPRIYGSNARLLIVPEGSLVFPVPLLGIPIGEIDSFKAKSTTTTIKSRPAGFINEGVTLKYGGYELSMKVAKVDWGLAHLMWLQDQALRSGDATPEFAIEETIKHYNGAEEKYIYRHVNLFGLDMTREEQDCDESITGFSPFREMGITDSTTFSNPSNLIRSGVYAAVVASRMKSNIGALIGNVASVMTGIKLPGTTPGG